MNEEQQAGIERIVLETLAVVAGRDIATISPQTSLLGDLGLDSASALQLLVELEDAFGIVISSTDAARMQTVDDVLGYLRRRAVTAR